MVIVKWEILKKLINVVSRAVFDPFYFIIFYLTYIFYKKNINIDYYSNKEIEKLGGIKALESSIHGVVLGIIGSLIMNIMNIPIDINKMYILLIPISILLSIINPRLTCFSYSTFILGIISLIIPSMKINILPMILLVAVLHLVEAILIYLTGARDSIPVTIKRDDEYVGGYLMQKYWPIPMAITTLAQGLIPSYGLLGYSSITTTTSPKVKSRKMGVIVFLYALILLVGIKYTHIHSIRPIWLLLTMPVLHEIIYYIDNYIEYKGKPLYLHPQEGIRVLDVIENSIGERAGIKRGDVIISINDIKTDCLKDYKNLIKQGNIKLIINIIRLSGQKEKLTIIEDSIFYDIGILFLVKKNLLYNK